LQTENKQDLPNNSDPSGSKTIIPVPYYLSDSESSVPLFLFGALVLDFLAGGSFPAPPGIKLKIKIKLKATHAPVPVISPKNSESRNYRESKSIYNYS